MVSRQIISNGLDIIINNNNGLIMINYELDIIIIRQIIYNGLDTISQ